MKLWTLLDVFTDAERRMIHSAMLRILDEVGLVVENERILDRLASLGARIEKSKQLAKFPPEAVEKFLAESEKFDWSTIEPRVRGITGVYYGHYLDPETGEYQPWTVRRVLSYLKIAHHLEHTDPFLSVIVPLQDVPREALVPFYHYLTFKFFGRSACSLDDLRWNPCIFEMCEAVAEETGASLRDLFAGYVFMIPPLRLGRQEADVLEFWMQRGLPVDIGNMTSAGGTAPVTLAGALTQHLATEIAINMLRRACFGDRRLVINSCISHIDMRTGMYPYGRPEKEMTNIAMADLARHYGARCASGRAHTDAKRPSTEAGFQKALSSIPSLMATGMVAISCGQLSVDEIFSPIQMVIDDEMVSALKYFIRGFEVSEETLAVDLIRQVGPGGQYLDTEHTLRHYRQAVWEPRVFSREMFAGWRRNGSRMDTDIALEIWHDLIRREPLQPRISDKLERRLLDIVRKASGVAVEPVEAS